MRGWLRFWPWAILGLMAVCVFVMNVWCVPSQDELAYAFTGMAKPIIEPVKRISSFPDVVAQQLRDYTTSGGNGRVLLHGVVAMFAGFRLYTLFDALNTVMWFLLVWLVLREGRSSERGGRIFVMGATVCWWTLWYAETCSTNAAYAVNYLWTAVATVAMMALWRHPRGWLVPLAFVYGWTQEAFVLPLLVALAGGVVVRSLAMRRLTLSTKQAMMWGLILAGSCFLCFGPAARARAGGLLKVEPLALMVRLVKAQADVVLYPTVVVLGVALVWIVWRRRRALGTFFMEEVEWWIYTVAAYGLYTICQVEGGIRLLFPCLLGCTVLVIRNREAFRVPVAVGGFVAGGTLCWMIGAAFTQVRVGQDIAQMCAHYATDPQGITWRPARNLFPFLFSCDIGPHSRDNLQRFQWEVGRQSPPMAVLSPELYAVLRHEPERFFDAATPIDGTAFSVRPEWSLRLAARMGDGGRSDFCPTSVKSQREFMPGRFRLTLFPSKDCFVSLPSDSFTFVATDGAKCTLKDMEVIP